MAIIRIPLSTTSSSSSRAIKKVLFLVLLGSLFLAGSNKEYNNYSCATVFVNAYVPPAIQQRWRETNYAWDDAIQTIEEAADAGEDCKDVTELYYAVRYIDRNAHLLYRNEEIRHDLFQRAKGSWELRLAYEVEKSRTSQVFYPYPDFRKFAMAFITVEDDYFGKGIGTGSDFSFVALGGPVVFNYTKRQVFMEYEDFYINGRTVPGWDLSYFMRGYARNWIPVERKRPPLAFTIIAVSPRCMVVRGSKTGGMAIFRRMNEDMREAAYGSVRHDQGGI